MPWSRTSEGSLAIYGDEGEWIATCASAAIAREIVGTHNSPGWSNATAEDVMQRVNEKRDELFSTPAPPLRLKGSSPRFDADVDALIDITDGHLAKQALKNDGAWGNVVKVAERVVDGWTTTL